MQCSFLQSRHDPKPTTWNDESPFNPAFIR
jgi:hypothetical protein